MARFVQPLLPAKPPTKTARVTTVAAKPAAKTTTPNRATARRKRQFTRTLRRFESAFAWLPQANAATRQVVSKRPFAGLTLRAGWIIGTLVVAAIVAGVAFLQSDLRWFVYRDSVQIRGLTFLNADEIYTASAVDSWNVFWLRASAVRERVIALPHVKDASVAIQLPNRVVITVQEEAPVALWMTNPTTYWIMPDGVAMPVTDERFATLPQLVDPQRDAQSVLKPDQPAVDPAVLAAALQLLQKMPEITQLRFNGEYGLNFNLPGGSAWVYWGDGSKVETKLANLAAAQQLIAGGEADPQLIDVRFERAYIQ